MRKPSPLRLASVLLLSGAPAAAQIQTIVDLRYPPAGVVSIEAHENLDNVSSAGDVNGASPFRVMVTVNACSALRDESDGLILQCVEETLKDPELREKIDYHARQILKAIAAKL